jgi:hypothetical protein
LIGVKRFAADLLQALCGDVAFCGGFQNSRSDVRARTADSNFVKR